MTLAAFVTIIYITFIAAMFLTAAFLYGVEHGRRKERKLWKAQAKFASSVRDTLFSPKPVVVPGRSSLPRYTHEEEPKP